MAFNRISSSYVKSLACDLNNVSQSIKPESADHLSANFSSPYAYKASMHKKYYPSRKSCQPVVAFDARRAASGKEDKQALDAVLKFYSVIKNQNMDELSELIGEECRCVCNFISFFQAFHGKEQVLGFLSLLMNQLGKKHSNSCETHIARRSEDWSSKEIRMGHYAYAYRQRCQLPHITFLPWEGGHKEYGDVHGTLALLWTIQIDATSSQQVMAIMTALADRVIWLATSENKATRILLVFLAVLSIVTVFLFTRIALKKP